MFKIDTSALDELAKRLGHSRRQMQANTPKLLEAIGVQLLSLASLAYRTKARGGTGSDGITWKDVKQSTKDRKSRRGSSKKRTGPRSRRGSKMRPPTGSVEIGVDTGLQRASVSPGFQGPDEMGGNVFQVSDVSVTVGFGREYSEYFDEERPLLPDELPVEWADEVDDLIQTWADQQLELLS